MFKLHQHKPRINYISFLACLWMQVNGIAFPKLFQPRWLWSPECALVYIDRFRVPLTILAPTLCGHTGHTECEFGICRCQHTLQALGISHSYSLDGSALQHECEHHIERGDVHGMHGAWCMKAESMNKLKLYVCIFHLFNFKTNMYFII